MIEIAINQCPRGYLLSEAGLIEYMRRKNLTAWPTDIDQSDRVLVQMMKEDMGKRFWAGKCSQVTIATAPDGSAWSIESKRGRQWVAAHA